MLFLPWELLPGKRKRQISTNALFNDILSSSYVAGVYYHTIFSVASFWEPDGALQLRFENISFLFRLNQRSATESLFQVFFLEAENLSSSFLDNLTKQPLTIIPLVHVMIPCTNA